MNTHALAGTVTGTASVEIRQPIAVSQTQALNFGIINTFGDDRVTIRPDSSSSVQNSSSISGGTSSAAQFTAFGDANAAISISFTDSVVVGSGTPMQITNFAHDAGSAPSFSQDGVLEFAVGSDLVINPAQTPGFYSGSYQVMVDYQ